MVAIVETEKAKKILLEIDKIDKQLKEFHAVLTAVSLFIKLYLI